MNVGVVDLAMISRAVGRPVTSSSAGVLQFGGRVDRLGQGGCTSVRTKGSSRTLRRSPPSTRRGPSTRSPVDCQRKAGRSPARPWQWRSAFRAAHLLGRPERPRDLGSPNGRRRSRRTPRRPLNACS
jgi:hypothetical protein